MAGNGGITGAPVAPSQFGSIGGGDNLQSIMNGTYGQAMEASFKEFCDRPENKEALAKHQQSEMRKAQRLNRKMKAMEFKEKVLESDYDAQKNIAPFLDNRVLRKIVQTFTNDPRNDFSKWANNPMVIKMLTQCKELMDEGRMTEDEVEHFMLQYLQDPENPAHHDFKLKTKQQVRLGTEQLVGALNEHLQLRRQGNDLYKARKFKGALKLYENALGITKLVVGMSSADQKEIDTNKVACLLNIAAVHLALQDFGAAAQACTDALEAHPNNIKALLRRAKAYIGRSEYEAARADLAAVKDQEPWNWEAEEEERRLAQARRRHLDQEKELAQGVFQA